MPEIHSQYILLQRSPTEFTKDLHYLIGPI